MILIYLIGVSISYFMTFVNILILMIFSLHYVLMASIYYALIIIISIIVILYKCCFYLYQDISSYYPLIDMLYNLINV